MRDRFVLLLGLFVLFGLLTLGPGLITQRGQSDPCPAAQANCSQGDSTKAGALDYHADDGRVEGNAGDLIAIYCQHEYRNINVYSISGGSGTVLGSFSVDQLITAGSRGLTVDLKEAGTVSMSARANNKFYVVLKGSVVAASGLNTYAKLFTCDF